MLCAGRGFSVRASHGLLPPRAPDMLTVRIGQLTVWGLSPHQIRSLVGCSPNPAPQPRPEAGATQERSNCLGCQGGLVYFFSFGPPGLARACDASAWR